MAQGRVAIGTPTVMVACTSDLALERGVPRAILGFCRLFKPLGCALGEGASLMAQGRVGHDLRGEIYLGAEPTWGTQQIIPGDRYIVPGAPATLGVGVDAAAGLERPFFAETLVWAEQEFAAATLSAAAAGDPVANEALLEAAESFEPRLNVAVEVLAGLFGLRFHRQFVLVELSSCHFAIVGERSVTRIIGSAAENLETLALNSEGRRQLVALPDALMAWDNPRLLEAGEVLAWLRRAWGEYDAVAKFLALFIPLEMVLLGVAVPEPASDGDNRRQLLELIRTANFGGKANLERWAKDALQRRAPSLAQRFENVARSVKLNGWEADVQAFAELNRRRNALLHRGVVSAAASHVTVGEHDVRSLEDLTERYVCFALCGDARVYSSEWRVGPGPDSIH